MIYSAKLLFNNEKEKTFKEINRWILDIPDLWGHFSHEFSTILRGRALGLNNIRFYLYQL